MLLGNILYVCMVNKVKLWGAYYQMKSCAVAVCCIGALFLGLQMRLAYNYIDIICGYSYETAWLHLVKANRKLN